MKKMFLFAIPLSVCNLRCHYCYLTKRKSSFEGFIPEMRYSPEEVAYAMRPERVGGGCYFNLCADGETLILPDIERYIELLAKEGHYIEVVSNMVLTKRLDKVVALGQDVLSHVEFKCSFHWQQLKERGMLDTFADNVNRAYEAGASINVEVTPPDELIPEIDELKEFSLEHFGALPQLSIARDDSTGDIERLTDLSLEDYNRTWSSFGSEFWDFKTSIFGKKQTGFCYAGAWSYYVNMATGDATQCYCGSKVGNLFAAPDEPLPEKPIGRCPVAHCYNGHMLLTLGLIPGATNVRYGDIRDRERGDGTHWLQPELHKFFNEKVSESNDEFPELSKYLAYSKSTARQMLADGRHALGKIVRRF